MNPIVVSRPLQWLARVDRSVEILLPLAVIFGGLSSFLNLNPLPFAILLGHFLLVMCELRLFHKVMFRVFNGTKNTFVLLQ